MWMFLIDVLIFFYMAFLAITERGTITGWLAAFAAIVLATFMAIRIKNT
jgi:nucleoside recognition membrane protein YjiH